MEKNGLSSVCRIARGIARRGEGLAKWGQRRNDFGARVGRDAQKGNVGVHHYCFLLGQRLGEGSRRMLEGAQDGGSGPGPTPTKVQVGATATPSPMAMGIIKAETR